MKHRVLKYLLIMVMCLFLVIGCVVVNVLVNMKNAESTTGEENKAGIESEDGIEGGITEVLSHIKVYESDTLVCYEDRIFKRFSYAEDNVNNVTAIVQGMLKRCPTLENIYVMPIPS
ncbi:MAG: hypothetical protein IJB96_06735, partial [Lachnospira sp.]|nr:hypothetical protein [Lachnospira sp.]